MKTRVTVVLTQVDEVLGLDIDEDSDGEEEEDSSMDVEYEGTSQSIHTEGAVVAETIFK